MEISFDFHQTDGERPTRDQADRMLACFQKALGHELPNQLVALQGLARVLELELADRLDEESRSHLQRLSALARRVDECIRTLAQVGHWCRDPGPVGPVVLAELACEAVAEVNLLSPGWSLEYDGLEGLPTVLTPRPVL